MCLLEEKVIFVGLLEGIASAFFVLTHMAFISQFWAHPDSNQGPTDYESAALTN